MQNDDRSRPPATAIITLLLFAMTSLAAHSGCCPPLESKRRMLCSNNLKQIGLAMHQYQMVHGSFPPAYVTDEDGQPLYSWRVLLLPYLEQSNLYESFDKNQAWNSKANIHLVNQAPPQYQCPSARGDSTTTSYAVVVGPETMFPGDEGVSISAIRDGTSRTIMVVELQNSTTHWAEPVDILMEEFLSGAAGSNHPRGMFVAIADGSVHFLSDDVDSDTLQALLTRDGGEDVGVP